jgi:hypothetical protein
VGTPIVSCDVHGAVVPAADGAALQAIVTRLDRLSVASSLPDVLVKEWLHPGAGVFIRLLHSFDAFTSSAAQHLCLGLPVKLYWLKGSADVRTNYVKLRSDDYPAFVDMCREKGSPSVYVVSAPTGSTEDPPSPENPPVVSVDASPAKVARSPEGKVGGAGAPTSTSRDSRQQASFREAVRGRDEFRGTKCFGCEREFAMWRQLEAAHIVPWSAPDHVVRAAGLSSAWDTCNGVMLCCACHLYFDDHMWTIRDGRIEVADALLGATDAALRTWFQDMHHRALTPVPSTAPEYVRLNQPRASVWEHHACRFDEAKRFRDARRMQYPFLCGTCGKAYKMRYYYEAHVRANACRASGGSLMTPADAAFLKRRLGDRADAILDGTTIRQLEFSGDANETGIPEEAGHDVDE